MKDAKPRTGIASWWQGHDAGAVDFTNPAAATWFTERLRKLQQETGIDAFKFDAGEVLFLPTQTRLHSDTDPSLWPNLYTTKYIETCASFGGIVEVRSGHFNQASPLRHVFYCMFHLLHFESKI